MSGDDDTMEFTLDPELTSLSYLDTSLPPLGDNSNGSPDMQPSTPTGTGTGYYIDPSQQVSMMGTIQQALNYAIQQDQTKFALAHGVQTVGGTIVPTPAAAQAMRNQQMMLFAGIALVAYLVLGRK